jgi:hypothetical protein
VQVLVSRGAAIYAEDVAENVYVAKFFEQRRDALLRPIGSTLGGRERRRA